MNLRLLIALGTIALGCLIGGCQTLLDGLEPRTPRPQDATDWHGHRFSSAP